MHSHYSSQRKNAILSKSCQEFITQLIIRKMSSGEWYPQATTQIVFRKSISCAVKAIHQIICDGAFMLTHWYQMLPQRCASFRSLHCRQSIEEHSLDYLQPKQKQYLQGPDHQQRYW